MRPKDLVMDLFGDYVRYMGGSIRLGQIVELLALFDVEPATTRVTLSRMRKDGWVAAERQGREMLYSATPKLLKVLDEGRERIFSPSRSPWTGQWTMVLYQIPETRRRQRERLKRTLAWEGFGQLNSTTWVSPHSVREQMYELLGCESDPTIHVVTMSTGSWARDKELAAQCWDLEELAVAYRRFIEEWGAELDAAAQQVSDEEAWRLRVKLVWDYRHFPFRDPNLPQGIQPPDWPGDEAYTLFVREHQRLTAQANAHISAVVFGGGSGSTGGFAGGV
ncbi:PaaX family transcriptional regulator [Nocardiopsis nanhaiensis]